MKLVFYWKQDHTKVTGEVLETLLISPFPPHTIYGVGRYGGKLHRVDDMYVIYEHCDSDDL